MQGQYQYGMVQGSAETGMQNAALNIANELNAKIRARALYVMKHSGFFPGSMTAEEMEESDEFHDLCMDLGHAFLKGFADNFIVPFDYDAGPTE